MTLIIIKNKEKNPEKHDVLKKIYSDTKIKVRNFLTNVAYSWLNKSDNLNKSFVVNA